MSQRQPDELPLAPLTCEPGAFWRTPIENLLQVLETRPEGLSGDEAGARLRSHGPNAIEVERTFVLARKLGRPFAEPLGLILIATAIVSAWDGDRASFWMILVTVTISVLLDFIQEHRAERAAEALQRAVAIHADVRAGDPCAGRWRSAGGP